MERNKVDRGTKNLQVLLQLFACFLLSSVLFSGLVLGWQFGEPNELFLRVFVVSQHQGFVVLLPVNGAKLNCNTFCLFHLKNLHKK